jgi:hypothetical protein
MNSVKQKTTNKNDDPGNDPPVGVSRILLTISEVLGSIARTTVRFVKNIPSRIQNKYMRYRNEKNRLPKRRTKNKVYVLVGYTTKEHVDRKYAAIKVQHLIRRVLMVCILIVFLVIMYNWLNPLGNTTELKQIIGINKIDDLALEDPFGSSGETNQIQLSTTAASISVTPTP